jgi:tetratricopeptide (TPR) repeat protein
MIEDINAQAAEPKARIFISYSRKDMAFADRLDAALKARGFEPLIDRTEIYAFEDWWKRLEALITRADTVVFVLSPDSVASHEALKEIEYAAALNKRFAPIVCRRAANSATPEALRRLNFIFFDDSAQFEASADKLAEAMQTDIGWIRKHTEFGEAAHHWSAAGRPGGLLLRPPDLEEAEHWIAARPQNAPAPTDVTRAFVVESRRGATRRRDILTGGLAVGLLAALALAGLAYWQRGIAVEERQVAEQQRLHAEHETQRADRNFTAAKDTVDGLISNIAQGLSGVVGMRVDTIRKILGTVQTTIDQITLSAPDDPQLLRSRSVMFTNFVVTYLAAGDLQDAAAAATQGLAITRKLAAQDQGNAQAQRDMSVSLNKLGDVKLRGGDQAGALAAYQEGLDIARKLAAQDQGNAQARRDVSVSLERLGDVKLQGGDQAGGFAAYQEGLDIVRKLAAQDQGNAQAQRDVSVSVEKLGDVKLRGDDQAGALAAYQEGLDIRRKLAAQDQGNAQAQRDVSVSVERLGDVKLQGGDQAGALAAYREDLDITRKLATQDQGNAQAQTDLIVSLYKMSTVADPVQARAALTQGLSILEKLEQEQKLTAAQKNWPNMVRTALSKLP